MTMIVPPVQILEAFVRVADPLHSLTVSNLRVSASLTAIRDALLPKLLSGDLRIADPEVFLARVGMTAP